MIAATYPLSLLLNQHKFFATRGVKSSELESFRLTFNCHLQFFTFTHLQD